MCGGNIDREVVFSLWSGLNYTEFPPALAIFCSKKRFVCVFDHTLLSTPTSPDFSKPVMAQFLNAMFQDQPGDEPVVGGALAQKGIVDVLNKAKDFLAEPQPDVFNQGFLMMEHAMQSVYRMPKTHLEPAKNDVPVAAKVLAHVILYTVDGKNSPEVIHGILQAFHNIWMTEVSMDDLQWYYTSKALTRSRLTRYNGSRWQGVDGLVGQEGMLFRSFVGVRHACLSYGTICKEDHKRGSRDPRLQLIESVLFRRYIHTQGHSCMHVCSFIVYVLASILL